MSVVRLSQARARSDMEGAVGNSFPRFLFSYHHNLFYVALSLIALPLGSPRLTGAGEEG